MHFLIFYHHQHYFLNIFLTFWTCTWEVFGLNVDRVNGLPASVFSQFSSVPPGKRTDTAVET